ncbi:MAG: lactate utilization protein [Clostridia bacterium]|nr:lactate utilization protein [Clostridia bacterium]
MGLKETFERRGFRFVEFQSKEEAVAFLCAECAEKTVSFGGSVTVQELNLYEELQKKSECSWHWKKDPAQSISNADVFITSANAVSETGEIVNIDGHCNRVSASIYGHKQVYFVFGENKLTADLPEAWNRARNVAAPKNAKRLNRKTPCAIDGVCHDCQSPECICSAIAILRRKPSSCDATLVLIRESLGY